MHRQYNEDLFESTKMTFGEHLEELRLSLIKAILAFVIGFLIALLFAGRLVDYVQTPLKAALRDYYGKLAEREYRKDLIQKRDEGKVAPEDVDAAAKRFAKKELVPEDRLVDRKDLAEVLKGIVPPGVLRTDPPIAPGADKPDLSAQTPDAAMPPDDMVKLRLYHHLSDDPRVRIIGLRVEEPFVVYMKAAVTLGAILASPFVFYFIWQFVAAGLYPHEQRYVHIFLPFSLVLFLSGAALAFFGVFKFVLRFFFTFSGMMGIDLQPRITDWLSFVLVLPLGFGIAFQLPLVMLFLERIGIFTIRSYLSSWRMSVLVIAFLSMILTPSDPYSMLLMMTPLIGLYFFGIMLCTWMPRRATQFGETIA